jgi:hypothetical protein
MCSLSWTRKYFSSFNRNEFSRVHSYRPKVWHATESDILLDKTRGRILGRNQDKSLKSFPPYSVTSMALT